MTEAVESAVGSYREQLNEALDGAAWAGIRSEERAMARATRTGILDEDSPYVQDALGKAAGIRAAATAIADLLEELDPPSEEQLAAAAAAREAEAAAAAAREAEREAARELARANRAKRKAAAAGDGAAVTAPPAEQ